MDRILVVALGLLASSACGKTGAFAETDTSGESTGAPASCFENVELIQVSGEVVLSWSGEPVSMVVVRENIGGVIADGLLWWISCDLGDDCMASPVIYGDEPNMTHTNHEAVELAVGGEYMVLFFQEEGDPACAGGIPYVVELAD